MPVVDATVVPTILTADPQQYRALVEAFNGFTKRVQIDVSDGDFTAASTVPLHAVWWPQDWQIDLHLMISRPSAQLDTILKLKPTRVILHAEASEDLTPLIAQLKNSGIKVGLALLQSSFPGKYQQYLKEVDHILIFAGTLGQQGGQADLMQIEKIPLIKEINPQAEIGWDGGINMDNIRAIAHAGVDILNVGSAITNAPDRAAAYQELTEEANARGVKVG